MTAPTKTKIPLTTLLFFSLPLSVLATLSSTNWPMAWCMLELNMMLFLLFLSSDPSQTISTAMTTYFLAQSFGSSVLLLGALLMTTTPTSSFLHTSALTLLTLGILIKSAAAPCHHWFIISVPHLSWPSILILSTLQKMIPFLIIINILSSTTLSLSMLLLFAVFNFLTGAMGMFFSTNTKLLIAYSSLHHFAWILTAALINSTFTAHLYMIIYMFSLILLMTLISILPPYSPSSYRPLAFIQKPKTNYPVIIMLMTLAGLPPLPMFFPKLAILTHIASISPSLTFLILMTTAMASFCYLRFALTLFTSP